MSGNEVTGHRSGCAPVRVGRHNVIRAEERAAAETGGGTGPGRDAVRSSPAAWTLRV